MLLLSSAVVWFGFGVDLSVFVGEVDFVVRVRRREPEVGLVFDFVLVEVLDEGLDRLLLGEDAVGEDWESCMVPPSTFFWTPIVEGRLVDGESCWVLTFPLSMGVVALDCIAQFVGLGVMLLEFREIRHWIESMSVSMRIKRMTIM